MEVLCFHVFSFTFLTLLASSAFADVVLRENNVTVSSFGEIQADFTPKVKDPGVCGVLHFAEPLDACSPLTNGVATVQEEDTGNYSFVLIVRGGCTFENKVRSAQSAGFKAAVIYDNVDEETLVGMGGNSAGINIHAVFISEAAGRVLRKYTGLADLELCIITSFPSMEWSIQPILILSPFVVAYALVICFGIHTQRSHLIRRERPEASHVRDFRGMSSRLVKAIPSLIFKSDLEDNSTSVTCAICLEDYGGGEKLRILPCRHKFHASCVDSWLTSRRTFCPICKRDARTSMVGPPASEFTPLLSSNPSSVAPSRSSTPFNHHITNPQLSVKTEVR